MSNLQFTKTHEWVQTISEGVVRMGLSDYAQKMLGDLVFVNLPEAGDSVTMAEVCCDVESVKAVSDVYSPVTGVIKAVNEELLSAPELINQDAHATWFIEVANVSACEDLLDEAAYTLFCESESK